MSLPTGVLSYGATYGLQSSLSALNAQLTAVSGSTLATASTITPMGTEGASIVSTFQQQANQGAWHSMFQAGMANMVLDSAASAAHVAEVQACDVAGGALIAAVDTSGLVFV